MALPGPQGRLCHQRGTLWGEVGGALVVASLPLMGSDQPARPLPLAAPLLPCQPCLLCLFSPLVSVSHCTNFKVIHLSQSAASAHTLLFPIHVSRFNSVATSPSNNLYDIFCVIIVRRKKKILIASRKDDVQSARTLRMEKGCNHCRDAGRTN